MTTWEMCEEFALTSLFDVPSSPSTDISPPNSPVVEPINNTQWDHTLDPIDTWSEITAPNTWGDEELSPLQKVQHGVANTWAKRRNPSRYERVIVLLISWEAHDFEQSIEESTRKYTYMFESLYGYEVWNFKIPSKKPHLAFTRYLVNLAAEDSPETLFLIWYDGHGLEHKDRRGSPRWCSHMDPEKSQTIDSSILSTTLGDCEADILLVNNACNSLTCDRFNGSGIVESISASAFNTSTYGDINATDLSPSMTWAVHRILSDEKCVEDGITVAELHRRICLATQYGSDKYPKPDELNSDEVCWHTSHMRTQPVYTRLSADAAGPGGTTRSIVLRKLAEPRRNLGGGTNTHIQVRLGIDNPGDIDIKEWIDWITSAPSGVYFPLVEMVETPEVTLFER
ncbi:hypothetical protein F5Y12DRAFT_711825 [Xylaria sp. FL1777]|nr:hypothetical protein F5Y12DRAFT_711825 [Xylaria sp. FL1777]